MNYINKLYMRINSVEYYFQLKDFILTLGKYRQILLAFKFRNKCKQQNFGASVRSRGPGYVIRSRSLFGSIYSSVKLPTQPFRQQCNIVL